MKKIKLILGVCLLVISMANLHAQTKVYLKLKDGTQTSYNISDVQKIVILPGNTNIYMKDTLHNYVPSSNLRYINFQNLSSISNPHENRAFGINIFPNPMIESDLSISYTLSSSGPVLIEIFNAYGIIVKQLEESGLTGINESSFQLNDLPSGTYTCRITSGEHTGTQKIIKL